MSTIATRSPRRVAQVLRRDRGVVEVARAAVGAAGRRGGPGGRQQAYAAGAPSSTRSAAVSAASTAPRAASHVPGPIGVIVSNAKCPSAPRSRPGRGRDAARPGRGAAKMYGTTRSGPVVRQARPPTQSSQAPARKSSNAASWTARARRRDVRLAGDEGGPAAASARGCLGAPGSSSPGVRHADPDLRRSARAAGASLHTAGIRPSRREPTARRVPPRDRPARSPRSPAARPRHRIGALAPGPANAITDVAGVAVGHVTVSRDEPAGRGSRGPA